MPRKLIKILKWDLGLSKYRNFVEDPYQDGGDINIPTLLLISIWDQGKPYLSTHNLVPQVINHCTLKYKHEATLITLNTLKSVNPFNIIKRGSKYNELSIHKMTISNHSKGICLA